MMVSKINMINAVGTATQVDSMNTLLTLGATSGTAIFLSQYLGAKDYEKVKKTFGFSIILSIIIGALFFVICSMFGSQIINFYTNDSSVATNGTYYLNIIKYSFIPSSLAFSYNYGFRSSKNTKIPLYISVFKMGLNVVLNYILIFGNFGLPNLGVQGAAIATVISQWVGLVAYIIVSIKTKQNFIGTLKEMFVLEIKFIKNILSRIYTLILNEVFFGFGETLYVKAFSVLGANSMVAYFVGNKISSVFYVLIMGISSASTIILGLSLGEGNTKKAKEESNYFLGFSLILAFISILFIVLFSKPMVSMFSLENDSIVNLSIQVVRVFSIKIALRLFIVIAFSALRAGGDSKFLSFIDSGIMWLVGIPLVFISVAFFELMGIPESKVTFRLWIMALLCGGLALSIIRLKGIL